MSIEVIWACHTKYWKKFKAHKKKIKTHMKKFKTHMKHLIKYLNQCFNRVSRKISKFLEEGNDPDPDFL